MPFRSPSTLRIPAAVLVPTRFKPGVFKVLPALVMIVGLIAISLIPAGCERAGEADQASSGAVIVSIPPLEGLIAPVLGPDHAVRVLVPSGRSVHGYRPTPKDIAALGTARVVVLVGLNLETGVARSARRVPVITMADALGIASENDEDHSGHDHTGHDHAHGSVDPHLWLDPVLAARFVRALPRVLPPELVDDETAARAERLAAEIDAVGEKYRQRLAPFQGRPIVTHHASFNRPAERYGLRVAAVLRAVETLEPSAADIAKSVEAIRAEGVGAIFVEPQFGRSSAERVAQAAGVELVTLDPLGGGDWVATMRTNLDALLRGLEASPGTIKDASEPAP